MRRGWYWRRELGCCGKSFESTLKYKSSHTGWCGRLFGGGGRGRIRFSAEKPGWLRQSTGLSLRAAFRIRPQIQKFQHHLVLELLWWGRTDSNHRSETQQIYSLSPLATRELPHIQLARLEPLDGLGNQGDNQFSNWLCNQPPADCIETFESLTGYLCLEPVDGLEPPTY